MRRSRRAASEDDAEPYEQAPASARGLVRSIVRTHRSALAGAGASTVLLTLADLAQPWPLKWVIDGILADRNGSFDLTSADVRQLALVAAAVVAIALVSALASYTGELSLKLAGERIAHDLRVQMYAHLQRLSLAFHDRRQKGDLVARLTEDANAVGTLFSESIGTMAQAVLVLVGMAIVAFLIDPVLGLAMFSIAPVLGVVTVHYRRLVKQTARKQRKREGELASLAAESLSAMRVVKAFGSESYEEERVTKQSAERRRFGMLAAGYEARFSGAVDVLGAVAIATVLVIGTLRVAAGVISVGDLVVIAQYARRMYRPLSDLAKQSTKAARSMARAERVAEILSADEVLEDRPGAYAGGRASGAVELRDVSFAYEPGRPVLEHISLDVPAGSRVAFVGASGAGKSTIGALVARFYDPHEGAVVIDGRDARDCSLDWLRDQVGLLLQDTVLFNGTVAENIAYGTDASREQIIRAATRADADGFIGALPGGYDSPLGPQGVGLSGGQRQRMGIARVLLRDPPILLLDEPTTGLDAASEAQVMEGLAGLMRDRTTVLITHSITLARTADRVVVLDGGRIVQDGPPEELLATPGPFRGLAAEQGLVPRRRRRAPPADRGVPSLRTLLDPDAAAELLADSLGGEGRLEDAAIDRVRYRPGQSVTVLYDCEVEGERHRVSVTSGASARLAELAADPASAAAAAAVRDRSPAATPLHYDDRLDALVQWLPLDLGLPLLWAPPERLARHVADAGGPVAAAAGAAEIVSYAPGHRATLRVGGQIVKGYGSERAFRRALLGWTAAQNGALGGRPGLLRRSRWTATRDGGLPAGPLRGDIPELRATVAAGIGTAPATDASDARAGELLRRLHAHAASGLPPVSADDVLRDTLRRARVLQVIAPEVSERVERLLERLADSAPPAYASVTSHGDFETRELIWRGGELAVADLGHACSAAPALDLAAYAADAALRGAGDAAQATMVLGALLEGYRDRPAGLRWYLSAALLRASERPFRRLEEHWTERVEQGVGAAEAVLKA
jgi:ABC-type multidrug transport system fused ATPase/permease subunit